VIEPIPGQEERNSDHLLENGAAIRCRNLPALAFKLDRILSDPQRLAGLRMGTTRLARPDAARVITETLLNDQTEPFVFAAEQRRRIIAAARGTSLPGIAEPTLLNATALYNDETGVYIGMITIGQMAFLVDQLEEEGFDDDHYYIDEATLVYLQQAGADNELLTLLRAALRDHGPTEIRFIRP
jgi:processive 1,2-diacylglycerol beta-glucosyltransferase